MPPYPTISGEDQKQVQDYIRREFNGLMREPKKPLYHYTEGAAAAAIVDQAKFWATNLLYLDDGRELQHAVDCLREAMARREHQHPGAASDLLDERVTRFLSEVGLTVPPDIWIAAFTERRDSTLHWQNYRGASHTVALGFSNAGMIRAAAANGALLTPCCYDDETKITVMARGLDLLERQVLGGKRARTPEADDQLLRYVMRELALFGALMKRSDLADENEWRLILCNTSQTIAGAQRINAVARADYTSLYVDLPLDDVAGRLPLSEIIIGPSPYRQLTERAFRTLLYKNGYENVAVTPSE